MKADNLTAIRIIATIMWTIAGLIANSPAGYLSAAASVIFLIAIVLEQKGQLSVMIKPMTKYTVGLTGGNEFDSIAELLGTKRQTYSIMGISIKETDSALKGRLRKVMLGVRGPEEG